MIKRYIMEGLDCANCASKIEREINRRSAYGQATVAFATKTLVLEGENVDKLLEIAVQVTKEIEPHVNITCKDGEKNESHHSHCEHCHEEMHNYHSHEDSHKPRGIQKEVIPTVLAILLVIVAVITEHFVPVKPLYISLYIFAYFLAGGEVLLKSLKNISKGKIFDENFLMSVASFGAVIIGEYTEGIAVMLLYRIGETFQDRAVEKSRKSISALLDIRPDSANLKTKEGIKIVDPKSVNVGDIIVIKPGEGAPLDGMVIKGNATVDTSALTGESVPKRVCTGEQLLSGSVVLDGAVEVEVTGSYENSTVSRIIDMAENAAEKKAKTEKFISRFAGVYTPVVTVCAVALAFVPSIFFGDVKEWIYRGLVFLVISCPCAMAISVPLTFFAAVGGASKQGILVKGGNSFDVLAKTKAVVLDKTGTVTEGKFSVEDISPVECTEEELLKICAEAEFLSNHPVAKAIVSRYGKKIEENPIENCSEISGKGICAKVNGKQILSGNDKLMKEYNVGILPRNDMGTVVYVAVDGKYIGNVLVADSIKPQAKQMADELKKLGVEKLVILSGDRQEVCDKVGNYINAHEVYGDLLPEDKVKLLSKVIEEYKSVIFVGDGINDAPAIAMSPVGVAMGGIGSRAAVESADVVLMNDNPMLIAKAIKISRKAIAIARQNIIFALGVKIIVLILGAAGTANMWNAVFADVGVCFIAILNSLRTLKK